MTIDYEMLDIQDVMNILHISEKTARKLFNEKDFPSRKIGRRLKVKSTDLDKWINKQ